MSTINFTNHLCSLKEEKEKLSSLLEEIDNHIVFMLMSDKEKEPVDYWYDAEDDCYRFMCSNIGSRIEGSALRCKSNSRYSMTAHRLVDIPFNGQESGWCKSCEETYGKNE